MKKILYALTAALLLMYGCANEKDNNTSAAAAPDLKDDFYESVNYDQLSSWVISADESSISHFTKMIDTNYERLNCLMQQAVLSNPVKETNKDEYNIKALYETAVDWKTRNTSGFGDLQSYLDRIDEAVTIYDLLKINMEMNRTYGITPIFSISVGPDLINAKKYSYYLGVNFALSRENWTSENDLFRTSFTEFLKNLWILNGTQPQEAEQIVNNVTNMMLEIAKKALTISESSNPDKINNPFPMSDIPEKLNNSIILDDLLQYYEAGAGDTVIIMDTGALNKLAEYFTGDNLLLLKNYIKSLIYIQYSNVVGLKSYKEYLAYTAQISGSTEIKSVEKSINEQLQNELFFELGRMYAAKYVSEEIQTNIRNMITEIQNIYRQRLNNLSWMSAETKAAAQNKLDKMKVIVGYDETGVWPQDLYEFYYTPKNEGGIFINNILSAKKANADYTFKSKNEPVRDDIVVEGPQTVNAFYSPSNNSIMILAGILQSPIYSTDASPEENAGGIGTIIAHEITHAFDNNGAKYDADGNFANWWQESDFQKFNELTEKVINYYNTYEIKGYPINGTLTLSENIADLGAVSCITEYALKKEYDLSKVYTAYGKMWATKKTDASEISAILNDTHSPAKIRVNAVLSAMDKFYEVFDIQIGNGMYKAPEERPSIW